MKTIQDTGTLLLYRVGPVYCCSPSSLVEAVVLPPELHHPAGSTNGTPGVFRHAQGMVKVNDLRYRFGLDQGRWQQPGKIIIATVDSVRYGFWVDEILDVIEWPQKGWGQSGALIPHQVFSRTLLVNENIYLYADFENIARFKGSAYLTEHIQQLTESQEKPAPSADNMDVKTNHPVIEATVPMAKNLQYRGIEKKVDNTTKDRYISADTLASVQNNKKTPQKTERVRKQDEDKKILTAEPRRSIEKENIPVKEMVRSGYKDKATPVASAESVKETVVSHASRTDGCVANKDDAHNDALKEPHNTSAYIMFLVPVLILFSLILVIYYMETEQSHLESAIETVEKSADIFQLDEALDKKQPGLTVDNENLQPTPAVEKNVQLEQPKKSTYHAAIERHENGVTIVLSQNPLPDRVESINNKVSMGGYQHKNNNSELDKGLVVKPVTKTTIIHIVVKGDTLWDIAKKYVDDPFKYAELAALSKIQNPDLIYPGEKVRIIKVAAD